MSATYNVPLSLILGPWTYVWPAAAKVRDSSGIEGGGAFRSLACGEQAFIGIVESGDAPCAIPSELHGRALKSGFTALLVLHGELERRGEKAVDARSFQLIHPGEKAWKAERVLHPNSAVLVIFMGEKDARHPERLCADLSEILTSTSLLPEFEFDEQVEEAEKRVLFESADERVRVVVDRQLEKQTIIGPLDWQNGSFGLILEEHAIVDGEYFFPGQLILWRSGERSVTELPANGTYLSAYFD